MEQQYCNLSFGPQYSQPLPDTGMQLLQEEMRTVTERSNVDKKKLSLTSEQRNLLEKRFTEGIRLDPARKTILSMELGLDSRQVAVWFQNRRARWKAKQLELSYHSLKLQLDAVCEENRRLQHEVVELRAMLTDTRNTKQICNEVLLSGSDNEAVRKMLAATVHGGSAGGGGMAVAVQQLQQQPPQQSDVAECQSYMLDGLDDIQLACYWAANYPPS